MTVVNSQTMSFEVLRFFRSLRLFHPVIGTNPVRRERIQHRKTATFTLLWVTMVLYLHRDSATELLKFVV